MPIVELLVLMSDAERAQALDQTARAYEAPGVLNNGQMRTYTTTVIIDTDPPPPPINLHFTVGSDTPKEDDRLIWDAPIAADHSPSGYHYRVFQSGLPITDTNALEGTSVLSSTTPSAPFAHIPSSRSFAVVSEDAAGNRSAPLFLETDVGKID